MNNDLIILLIVICYSGFGFMLVNSTWGQKSFNNFTLRFAVFLTWPLGILAYILSGPEE